MNDFQLLTTDQLRALPVGTFLAIRPTEDSVYSQNVFVWEVTEPGKMVCLTENSMPAPIDTYASDHSRYSTHMALDKWEIRVLNSPVPHGKPEKLRIYINRKLDITPNKRAAHAVHAALEAFGVHPGVKVIVLDGGPTKMEAMRISIHDAGHTELEPGTLTASTQWPEDSQA
jgi:PTH2 family peptidyl-tRNA hydrolase